MKQAAFFFSLILSMYMLGCQEDPCANQICTNGGTCIDGECDCPEGFIGPQCTIPLDPCITKACIESSTIRCEQGSGGEARCICEDGFEGDVCGDQWTDKFLGEFTASESCNGIGFNFDMNVLAGPEFKKFTLANFRNEANGFFDGKSGSGNGESYRVRYPRAIHAFWRGNRLWKYCRRHHQYHL